MKIQAPVNPRIAEIQKWISVCGGSIANAERVNKTALEELGSKPGTVMQVLWRLAKAEPPIALTVETMLGILEEKNLVKEVKKQLKLTSKDVKTTTKNFEKSRDVWVASLVPKDAPDREAAVKAVQRWVKTEIPGMTNREDIMKATELRIQAGKDIRPTFFPSDALPRHITEFKEKNPGRVYHDPEQDKDYLILKPGEKAEVTGRGLTVSEAPKAPEIS